MTNEDKIKQLETIIKYGILKLDDEGHYSASIQMHIALIDTQANKPISNNLENIVNSYLKSDA